MQRCPRAFDDVGPGLPRWPARIAGCGRVNGLRVALDGHHRRQGGLRDLKPEKTSTTTWESRRMGYRICAFASLVFRRAASAA